jgi:hypothetical protein
MAVKDCVLFIPFVSVVPGQEILNIFMRADDCYTTTERGKVYAKRGTDQS